MKEIDLEKLFDAASKLPVYTIEIGVFTVASKRKATVKVGLNNAMLMFIHENGSPLRHIPARPVLKMTIEHANTHLLDSTLTKALDAFIESGFDLAAYERELNKLCIKMENYAQELIYSNDGRLAPNSPAVASKKKGNHPLFDTGQLARSIKCRLVKEE